jgi:hypothetical protein
VEYLNPDDGSSVFPGNSAMSVYKTFAQHGMMEEFPYATQQKGLHNRHDATVANRKEIGLWLLN